MKRGSNPVPRASDGTRTHDLVLTKDALYQLSYRSEINILKAPGPPTQRGKTSLDEQAEHLPTNDDWKTKRKLQLSRYPGVTGNPVGRSTSPLASLV